MNGRLNQHMELVVLPNGGPGLVRRRDIPFRPKHGEEGMSEQDRAEKREREKKRTTAKKQRYVPEGQMVKHTRNLKRKYLGKEEMKYIRSRYFELRLSMARKELEKEAIPPIKPTVWIKSRPGKPGYMKEDPRLKRAIRAMRHTIRVQVPMDENINEGFGPFEKRPISDYPLIQVDSDDAKEIDQDPEKEITPKEVSLSTFLVRSQLVGNQSGDEQEFDPDGTPKLIKIEQIDQVTDDSEAEENSPDPKPSPAKNLGGQETAQGPQQGTTGAMEEVKQASLG